MWMTYHSKRSFLFNWLPNHTCVFSQNYAKFLRFSFDVIFWLSVSWLILLQFLFALASLLFCHTLFFLRKLILWTISSFKLKGIAFFGEFVTRIMKFSHPLIGYPYCPILGDILYCFYPWMACPYRSAWSDFLYYSHCWMTWPYLLLVAFSIIPILGCLPVWVHPRWFSILFAIFGGFPS